MNEEENKIVEEYENKENEILESVGKILPEITETKKFQDETSSKRAELYDELKEINNNIYSYPEDEKSIWEDKRESVKLEIKKIEDKISKRRESTEIKIKNVINDVKLELKKIDKAINDKESGIKLYRENIRMAIINEENKLKEEMSKDVSAQDMDISSFTHFHQLSFYNIFIIICKVKNFIQFFWIILPEIPILKSL